MNHAGITFSATEDQAELLPRLSSGSKESLAKTAPPFYVSGEEREGRKHEPARVHEDEDTFAIRPELRHPRRKGQ